VHFTKRAAKPSKEVGGTKMDIPPCASTVVRVLDRSIVPDREITEEPRKKKIIKSLIGKPRSIAEGIAH
jgi:hypothetical protein